MADREGGQWNVAAKENEVYLERASKDGERLFDDSLAPHEARELARLLTKFADRLDESGGRGESSEDDNDDDDSDDNDDDNNDDSDDSDESDESGESGESDDSRRSSD
ncbi:hypothetical protein A5765_04920 [Mycolicibacterium celeriflavum]|uniref:Uncharacterized protein n=1 Tax=Mycolicibacterium celeriflavum TaxID=1249101 RepID=A0A1X0BRP9_MYCCF|nr:hypothetical protein [Mycolicibacterium celeriflavum]MCV7238870.1 hypothetical protein [Mycolicibacterium celeriflavum]OBG18125.1 hypothetical protein A5765_04920 [Mycolicibacterium celeriflavum]ORA46221.1 hypothetical protein BST21_15785 [Mycolicibacterium celeriflavum]BBY42605.1 hypothetical protein MCEL_09000 [Mycolicibacterium celeriflavum]